MTEPAARPAAEPGYYALIDTGGAGAPAVGDPAVLSDTIDATTTPRTVRIADAITTDTVKHYIPDLIATPEPLQLARLTPAGQVIVSGVFADCPDGWTVAEILPFDLVLGPQAKQLQAAIAIAVPALRGEYDDHAEATGDPAKIAVATYYRAVADTYRGGLWLLQEAEDAAMCAIDDAGIDSFSWYQGFSYAFGTEMLALYARDLIGSTPSWNRDAYDALTGPWRAAFGPIHPDDAPVADGAAPAT